MNIDIATAALTYVNRGWNPVPLFGMMKDPTGGPDRCQCGTPCGKSAGKHPIAGAWQQRDWRAWAGWADHRGNVGIITGRISGFWVLDHDPDSQNGWTGHPASPAREIVDRLGLDTAHVRTGGGGLHWRFMMPGGFEVTNRRGRLPAGLDVRGDGGQVVAPPSVSGKGPYVELREGVDVAPAWLLDLIRPEDPKPPEAAMAVASSSGAGLPAGSDRAQRYAAAALADQCLTYSLLADGRRTEALFDLCCTAVRAMNTGRFTEESVYAQVLGAVQAARANAPGGLADSELMHTWSNARREVGAGRMDMGPDPTVGEVMPDAFAAPFSGPPVELGPDPFLGAPQDGAGWSTFVRAAMAPGGSAGTVPDPVEPVTPMELEIRRQHARLYAIEQARLRLAAGSVVARPPLASELIGADELDRIAEPIAVVDEHLYLDSLARINGLPGQGKSFVGVDLACSVASGTPWAGRPTRRGTVLYLAAEGLVGLKRRVRAWERDRDVKLSGADLVLFPRAVQIGGPEWGEFTDLVRATDVQLAIIDTQARVTAGRNENNALDMGEVVHHLEELRAKTGACILLIHHAGKTGGGDSGRGINSVEGATQSEFAVTKKGKSVMVRNTRQKDTELMPSLTFDLRPVTLMREVAPGMVEPDPVPAAVLVWRDGAATADASPVDIGKARQRALWEVLHALYHNGEGGTRAEIRAGLKDHAIMAEVSPGAFRNAWAAAWNGLIRLGLIAKRGERFRVVIVTNQSDDGVLTANPDIETGGVGDLGPSWTLWTSDDEKK